MLGPSKWAWPTFRMYTQKYSSRNLTWTKQILEQGIKVACEILENKHQQSVFYLMTNSLNECNLCIFNIYTKFSETYFIWYNNLLQFWLFLELINIPKNLCLKIGSFSSKKSAWAKHFLEILVNTGLAGLKFKSFVQKILSRKRLVKGRNQLKFWIKRAPYFENLKLFRNFRKLLFCHFLLKSSQLGNGKG